METHETARRLDAAHAGDINVMPADSSKESITQKAASSAHHTIDSAAEKAEEIEAKLRAGAVTAGLRLEESEQATMAQVEKSLDTLGAFVKGSPIAAAGMAFAAGVLATVLLRR